MKLFIKRFSIFCFALLGIILILFLGPLTPRMKQSYFYGINHKQKLLQDTPAPRIIFIGGSNLTFGINSRMIKDSLGLNPINTGIQANVGLEYMLDSSIDNIRKSDIVVVVPEYSQLHGSLAYGEDPLLHAIMSGNRNDLLKLSYHQWAAILPYIPKYAFSKLSVYEYLDNPNKETVYRADAFNEYGDILERWPGDFKTVSPYTVREEKFNTYILKKLIYFRRQVEEKGASLYIGFPAYQKKSFDIIEDIIREEYDSLRNNNFTLIGKPVDYIVDDSLLYDTPYHLTTDGVEWRTGLFLRQFSEYLSKN
ncbi:MAG TPA: hypothetical protein DIT04_08585 [Dysgonomonas sp.]|nr:hypothetical protein [Dysgonomonas sp.]